MARERAVGKGCARFFFLPFASPASTQPPSLSLSLSLILSHLRTSGRTSRRNRPRRRGCARHRRSWCCDGGGWGGAAAACVGPCVQVVEGELRVQGTLEGRRSVSTGRAGFLFLFFPRVPARGHAVWGDAPDAGVCIAIPIHRPASRGTGSGECALNWGQRGGRGARALKGAPRPRRALMLLSRARPLRAP